MSVPSPLAAPKRRRFRFGLKWIFVATAILACWLGSNLRFVQERAAMRLEIHQEELVRVQRVGDLGVRTAYLDDWKLVEVQSGKKFPRLPLIRQLMGDLIGPPFITRSTKDQALESMRVFPESTVWYCAGPGELVPQEYRDAMNEILLD